MNLNARMIYENCIDIQQASFECRRYLLNNIINLVSNEVLCNCA